MTGVLKSASLWARSSMVEQWPFKPLVKGSSPFALTVFVYIGFPLKNPINDGELMAYTIKTRISHWLKNSLNYK